MRILLAEDDPVGRRVLAALLTSWGYEVVVVSDGTAAWDVLSRPGAPTVALLDWEMPGLDGIEVCRRVRAAGSEPYVFLVLLTGRERRCDLLAGFDAGADDYLTKPCNSAELGARLRVATRITALYAELHVAREALRHRVAHDPLTGVLNRGGVLEALNAETAALARRGGSLGLASIDLDHFKRVNDTWGHPAGDAVLRETAARLRSALRPYDRIGRMGGEEFLLLLPDCSADALRIIGERVRQAVAAEPVVYEGVSIPVTCSVGIATVEDPAETTTRLRQLDDALYVAKRTGRNRVVAAASPPERMSPEALPS